MLLSAAHTSNTPSLSFLSKSRAAGEAEAVGEGDVVAFGGSSQALGGLGLVQPLAYIVFKACYILGMSVDSGKEKKEHSFVFYLRHHH